MAEQKLAQESTTDLIKRIEALRVSLKALGSSYEKLVKNLFQVLTKNNVVNRQTEMNNLNKELNNVLNNETIITEEIKTLSTSINMGLLKDIVDAQNKIIGDYRNANKGVNIAFGLDGNPIKSEDKSKYDSLYSLSKILREPIIDGEIIDAIAVVNKDKKDEVRDLLKKLDIKKEEIKEDSHTLSINEKLVIALYDYLDSLAKKISNYGGMSGLPIRETKEVEDKKWVVLASDISECNLIIEIIKIIKASDRDTVNVWDIADIKKDLISNFKKYANGTKYFAKMIPKISQNEAQINKIKDRLKELIKEAKNDISEELVLPENKREYDLLNKEYCYLMSAQGGDNLVPYSGVMLEPKYVINYQDAEKELQTLRDNAKIEQENANNELAQQRIQKRVLEFSNISPNNLGLVRTNKEQDV